MQRIKKAASPKPPAIDFDLNEQFADLKIAAIMCWPNDSRKRELNLAAMGLGIMGGVEEVLLPRLIKTIEMASRPDVLEKDLYKEITRIANGSKTTFNLAMGFIRGFTDLALHGSQEETEVGSFIAACRSENASLIKDFLADRIQPDVRNNLLGKGFSTAASSPSIDSVNEEIAALEGGDPRFIGTILATVASMAHFHTELKTASLRRAFFIAERSGLARAERSLKDAWKQFGPVAPLWAAALVLREFQLPKSGWLIPMLIDDTQKLELIATAKWFCNFAASYRQRNSPEALIKREILVLLPDTVEVRKPELSPLPPLMLEWAKEYKSDQ